MLLIGNAEIGPRVLKRHGYYPQPEGHSPTDSNIPALDDILCTAWRTLAELVMCL